MAEIFKKDGTWTVRTSYYDNDHKRHYTGKSGFRTKRSAEAYGVELEKAKKDGGVMADRNITFVEYFRTWYETFRKPKVSDATAARYQYSLNVITKYFGNTLFRKITTTEYQKFLNWYGLGDKDSDTKPHAKETVSKINVHIRAAVRNAVNDHTIPSDFTLNAHIVYDNSHTRPIHYLSYEEAAKLYQYTLNHLYNTFGYDVVRYMALTALLTGMRGQEVAGLTWDDVEFDKGIVDVNKSWNWKKREFGPTKNPQSMRKIVVDRNLLNIFKKLQYDQSVMLKNKGIENPHNLMFLSRYNRVPSSKALNDGVSDLIKGAGIDEQLTFHGLRHTHASILLYQKMSISYIARRLGHKNVSTTIKTYLHIIKELETEENSKVLDIMTSLGKGADWADFEVKQKAATDR